MTASPPLEAPLRDDDPDTPEEVEPLGRSTAPPPDPPEGGDVRGVAVPPVRTAPPEGRRACPSPDDADPPELPLDEPDDELDPEGRRTA